MNPSAANRQDNPQIDSLSEVSGALLTYTELAYESHQAVPESSIPQLWVHFRDNYLLRIFCANDTLSTQDKREASFVYYFVLHCPLNIPAALHEELHRLLDLLNTLLPLGTLELQPDEGLFFRHLLLTEEAVLDGLLGLDIIRVLEVFVPSVMDWLQAVVQQAPLSDPVQQQSIRQQFQALLKSLPTGGLNPPLLVPPLPKRLAGRLTPLQRSVIGALGLSLGLSALISWLSPSLGFLIGGATLLGGCFWGLRRQERSETIEKARKQNQQKQFFWNLLEVETIKLAYQDHALERHRHQVMQKLQSLRQTPVEYPSDIVRLRGQIRFLKQLQVHLLTRAHQLKLQRQEVEDNRFQLLKEQLFQQGEMSQQLKGGTASEDMLMQNLVTTLDYLDFSVQLSTSDSAQSPLILVYPRADLPPVSLSWCRQWHLDPSPRHSWMLSFELTLPLNAVLTISEVQPLLSLFRRFLPLGSLLFDSPRSEICLRYRFVRLRGDLSAMLVMEILEVLAGFGERLQTCLRECQAGRKDLSTILREMEAGFRALS